MKLENQEEKKKSHVKRYIPNSLSVFRIILSPILFFSILLDIGFLAMLIFLYCIISDKMDGYLARKYDVCSTMGGYLDVIADFSFVFLALLSLTLISVYPYWVLILISIIFALFLLTSNSENPVYDPLGKYYGSFLMLMVGIALIDHGGYIISLIPIVFFCYTVSALISRFIILKFFNSPN